MHFLYVARGSAGLIKVGLTSAPRARGIALAGEFRRRGDSLTAIKFAPPTYAGFGIENSICASLKRIATATSGREWFYGLDFNETYALVRESVMGVREFQLSNRHLYLRPIAA